MKTKSEIQNPDQILNSKFETPRDWAVGTALRRPVTGALRLTLLLALGFLGLGNNGVAELTIGQVASRVLDTKPEGTAHVGINDGAMWVASNSDGTTMHTGVMQFVATNRNEIAVPGTADFNSDVGTITFWLRTVGAVAANPGGEGAMIFDRRTGDGTVIVLHDNGRLFEQHTPAGVEGLVRVDDGNWHHVAITYDQRSTGFVSIYVDGVLDIGADNFSAWTWPTGQQVELGTSHDTYWRSFNGFLDDVRVYDRPLTEMEIAQVHSTGALVDPNALVLRFNFDAVPLGVVWDPPSDTLQSAINLDGTFMDVPGATAPYLFNAMGERRFFRTRQ